MRALFIKIKNTFFLILVTLAFNSCILDEFTPDSLKMKEDWNMEIVAPLFHGNFEFKDLISDWEELIFQPGDQRSILKYPDGQLLEIPTRIIFEPTILVNDFAIWINGGYQFSKVNFKYTVSNGAPFPLNFKLRFSENSNTLNPGPAILPPAFAAATSEGAHYIPVKTEYILPLNNDQLESFLTGEVVQFETWFNSSDLIDSQDTFLSNYPITISIVLYGEISAEI